MKYTKEERLEIGRQVYDGELKRHEAAEKYGISEGSARDYMRFYRDENRLPSRNSREKQSPKLADVQSPKTLEELKAMSKEDLIDALVMARINEARAKKGYMVEGVGAEKKFILFDGKNAK